MIKAHCLGPNDRLMRQSSTAKSKVHPGLDASTLSLVATPAGNDGEALTAAFQASARVACIGVFVSSALISRGWLIDQEPLKDPLSCGGKIHSSIALTFMLSALSLAGITCSGNASWPRLLGQILASVVAAIGTLTLVENLSGLDLNLNHIWWQPRPDAPGITFPGPMPPGVSVCFVLTGLGSLLSGAKTKGGYYPAQPLALVAAFISFAALLGHTCGVSYLCTLAGCIKIPLAAALLFMTLCYASLFLAGDHGLAKELARSTRAGALVRRSALLLAALPVPLWLKIAGEKAGLYDSSFGWALFGFCALTLFVLNLASTARTVETLDSIVERAESELTACKRIERMKQDFVADVSHELRTPLTSLQATLTLLAEGVYGDLSGTGEKRVRGAESNIARLISLINSLLDIEKMEAGKLRLTYANVNLADIIERSVETVVGFADQQGIKVRAETRSLTVLADSDRMVQVLVNLLSNAIKFSEIGEQVEIVIVDGVDCMEVQVIDHGVGIPAGYEETIFARYEQAHDSDGERRRGTGLGLPICKAIVEQHGGTVGVRPTEGGGSTFWISIPHASV